MILTWSSPSADKLREHDCAVCEKACGKGEMCHVGHDLYMRMLGEFHEGSVALVPR